VGYGELVLKILTGYVANDSRISTIYV